MTPASPDESPDLPVLPRLYERDIDAVLQEELLFNAAVRRLFAKSVGWRDLAVESCRLSQVDSTGETDVVADCQLETGGATLLVENKIDAAFQPDQPFRYRRRAQALSEASGLPVRCVLVAPQRYIECANREEREAFDGHVAYEALVEAIAGEGTGRALHRAALLRRAVERAMTTYQLVESPAASAFWVRVHAIASAEFPALGMVPPSAKGANSSWIIFKAGLPAGVTIDWKVRAAWVDLTFWPGRLSAPLAGLTPEKLPPGALLARAGASKVLRRPVAPPPQDGTLIDDAAIREALAVADALRVWFEPSAAALGA